MPELLPPARRALPLADPHVIGPRLTHLHGQDGLAISVHAPEAEALALCLFTDSGEERIALSGPDHGVWHGFVPGRSAEHTSELQAPGQPGWRAVLVTN